MTKQNTLLFVGLSLGLILSACSGDTDTQAPGLGYSPQAHSPTALFDEDAQKIDEAQEEAEKRVEDQIKDKQKEVGGEKSPEVKVTAKESGDAEEQDSAEEDEIVVDLTCELRGPSLKDLASHPVESFQRKWKTPLEVRSVITKSQLDKIVLKLSDNRCYDQTVTHEYVESEDKATVLSLSSFVCADGEPYWYARISSEELFPTAKSVNFGVDPKNYSRMTIGSESHRAYQIPVDDRKYKWLYLNCAPTKKD